MWSPSVMQSTPARDQLLVDRRRQARAAGGVLGVGDDQVELLRSTISAGTARRDDVAARLADDVADEQQSHGRWQRLAVQ